MLIRSPVGSDSFRFLVLFIQFSVDTEGVTKVRKIRGKYWRSTVDRNISRFCLKSISSSNGHFFIHFIRILLNKCTKNPHERCNLNQSEFEE